MDDVALARALHVLGVVIWIGGVAFVTAVLLPALRRNRAAEERFALFELLEGRFSWIAKGATLLVGASGFYMAWAWDLWSRFHDSAYWWMDAMVGLWALFTLILFVAEPLFLHRWLAAAARRKPASTLLLLEVAHWVLLVLALITVMGAAAGSHGQLF